MIVLRCINCNEQIAENMKFCPFCGTAQEEISAVSTEPSIIYCNSCKQQVSPTDKFCPFCGAPTNQISVPPKDMVDYQTGYSPYSPHPDYYHQRPIKRISSLEKDFVPKKLRRSDLAYLLIPAIAWITIEAFMNFGGFLIAYFIIELILEATGTGNTTEWSETTKNIVNLLFNIMIDTIALLFIFMYLLKKLNYKPSDIGIKDDVLLPNIGTALKGYLLAFGATFFISLFLQTIVNTIWEALGWGTEQETPYDRYLEGDMTSLILFLIVLVIVAPISEEIIYRGLLMRLLDDRGFSPFGTVVLSSLIFASVHSEADITAGTFNYAIFHFFGTFAIGITLATTYRYTRNLGVPILIHAINNGFAGITMLLTEGNYSEETETMILGYLGLFILGLLAAFFILLYKERHSVSVFLSDLNLGLKNILSAKGAIILSAVTIVAILIPVGFDYISDVFDLADSLTSIIWIGLNLVILLISLKILSAGTKSSTELEIGNSVIK